MPALVTPSDLGPEFSVGGVTANKITLVYATAAEIQVGAATSKVIDPATLKAAFGAAVSWPCVVDVNGARAIFGRNDASFDAVRGFASGSGPGSGVYGAASGTGSGSGVYGVADGTGGGSGVLGLVNGSGAGSGVYGAVNGSGNGNGLIGRVDGNGLGAGALLIVNGSGNGDGARAKVNGNGTGSGVSAAVYGAGNGHGASLSVGARDTSQPVLPDPTGTGYALYATNGTFGSRLTVAGFYRSGANTTYSIHANAAIYTSGGVTAVGTITAAGYVTTSDARLKRDIRDIEDKAAVEFSRRLRFVDFEKLMAAEPFEADHRRAMRDWQASVDVAKNRLDRENVSGGGARGKGHWQANKDSSSSHLQVAFDRIMMEKPVEPSLSDDALKISRQAGVIAQEIAQLAADVGYGEWLISTDADGYLRVDMQSLMMIVAKGNQIRLAALEGAASSANTIQ